MTVHTAPRPTGLVLDIDDTLCNTAHTCMELMAKELGMTAPFDAYALVQKYAQPWFVPDWQNEAGEKWVLAHLMDPAFLMTLPPMQPAIDMVKKLHQRVPVILYLTSRDRRLQQVTEEWLWAAGLPKAPVLTRPTKELDPNWKIHYLTDQFDEGAVLIDNEVHLPEPTNFKGTAIQIQAYPEHNHPNPAVININTWEDLETWIDQHLKTAGQSLASHHSAIGQ